MKIFVGCFVAGKKKKNYFYLTAHCYKIYFAENHIIILTIFFILYSTRKDVTKKFPVSSHYLVICMTKIHNKKTHSISHYKASIDALSSEHSRVYAYWRKLYHLLQRAINFEIQLVFYYFFFFQSSTIRQSVEIKLSRHEMLNKKYRFLPMKG